MDKRIKLISIVLIIVMLMTISTGCKAKPDEPTQTYAIDYDIQGYLFKENQSAGRVFIEEITFTARNLSWPATLDDGEVSSEKSSFEYISLRGFPSIDHEDALSSYTHEVNNSILEVQISMPGSIRDNQSGEAKLIVEAKYVMLIDKETEELLLCQVFAEMDGQYQQYYFSPSRNPDTIGDILTRAYTNTP
ncbi:MAG: hypothetical protein IJW14_04440 [Oscillospiraceae bacterium]|nr:hypothetical protein [Oscillospiraceae bacterium]